LDKLDVATLTLQPITHPVNPQYWLLIINRNGRFRGIDVCLTKYY